MPNHYNCTARPPPKSHREKISEADRVMFMSKPKEQSESHSSVHHLLVPVVQDPLF